MAGAFRAGEITALQAQTVLTASQGDAAAWLDLARSRTLRGLEDVALAAGSTPGTAVRFSAPQSEALVFSLGLRPGGGALLRARSGDVLLS